MDFEKLKAEAELSQKTEVQLSDQGMKKLPSERQQAWGSLLSSLAASENIESLILEPLISNYKSETQICAYLQAHGRDELKHYNWLTQFVKENTTYERTGKTVSDKIFYDFLLPRLARSAEEKPVYLFALMYFYELFTLDFYKELIRIAEFDKLENAQNIFQLIRRDEIRHCQAAKDLIRYSLKNQRLQRKDLLKIQALLRLFQLDMATFEWCVHNLRVRKSTMTLGIPPSRMWKMSSSAYNHVVDFLKVKPS